jgi:hypothetical protein
MSDTQLHPNDRNDWGAQPESTPARCLRLLADYGMAADGYLELTCDLAGELLPASAESAALAAWTEYCAYFGAPCLEIRRDAARDETTLLWHQLGHRDSSGLLEDIRRAIGDRCTVDCSSGDGAVGGLTLPEARLAARLIANSWQISF